MVSMITLESIKRVTTIFKNISVSNFLQIFVPISDYFLIIDSWEAYLTAKGMFSSQAPDTSSHVVFQDIDHFSLP